MSMRRACLLERGGPAGNGLDGAGKRHPTRRSRRPLTTALASGAATVLTIAALFGVSGTAAAKQAPAPSLLDSAAAAVPNQYAAAAAEQVLRQGGNAVDAAVAVGFVLAVTSPATTGLGGGGFMTLYVANQPYFLDFREQAPQGATAGMFLDAKGQVVAGASEVGGRAVAVPGNVSGLWEAQHRFGKLKWAQVLAPAIKLAHEGFDVDPVLAGQAAHAATRFAGKTNFSTYFAGLKAGSHLRQPELADTLQRLADNDARAFYAGHTGDLIADTMRGHGLISADDLANYRAAWRAPMVTPWQGHQVITASAPSTGGTALMHLLQQPAPAADDASAARPASAASAAAMAAAASGASASSAASAPSSASSASETSVAAASGVGAASAVLPASAAAPTSAPAAHASAAAHAGKAKVEPARAVSTQYAVVDRSGNAVVVSLTMDAPFGSGVVVSGAGFLLNDAMDTFAPSTDGTASRNAIAGGHRPASPMAPTVVIEGGKVILAVGAGGSGLPDSQSGATAQAHVIRAVVEHAQPLAQAATSFPEDADIQAVQVQGDSPVPQADPHGQGVATVVK